MKDRKNERKKEKKRKNKRRIDKTRIKGRRKREGINKRKRKAFDAEIDCEG